MEKKLPYISILIAVRNEENSIFNCLEAIDQLDYPKEKIEVLIGDDQSTDQTALIIHNFIENKTEFSYTYISKTVSPLKGKANVIEQLAQKSKGTMLLITDADVLVPELWAKYMVDCLNKNSRIGLASSITLPSFSNSPFSAFQSIDWLFMLVTVSLVSEMNLALTALGNNMIIRKDTYESVGGFKVIDNSITEDYAFLKVSLAKGWLFRGLCSFKNIATTLPVESFSDLLNQRKRWMKGAVLSTPSLIYLVWLIAVSPLLFLSILIYSSSVFYIVILIRWISIYPYLIGVILYYRKFKMLLYLPIYECYQLTFLPILALSFLNSKSISWKGRVYS